MKMIITDDLDEYQSIKCIISYCSEKVDCAGCKIKDLCDCMSRNPMDFDVEYRKKLKSYEKRGE